MKFLKILYIAVFSFLSCGNPAIVRYLSPLLTTESKEQPLVRKYLVYEKDGLKIFLKNTTLKDIQEISELGEISKMEYRIPPLTYIKLYVVNSSQKNFKLNFFKASLKTPEGKNFPIITEKVYLERFTSVAYTNFKFDRIFSFYTILPNGNKKKNKGYFEKFNPGTEITLKPEGVGIQLLPFERISEQFLDYILTLEISNNEKIEIPLKFVIYRKDFNNLKKKERT